MPLVSVIIPAYYSYATLADCLEALRRQSRRDFEVIVVNSSPEEKTRRVVENYPEVRFEQSPDRLYPHAARNRGVELARGELLVFTDPDCRARPDWLEQLLAAYDAGHPVVGGAMEPASDGWFERGVHFTKFSWAMSGLPAGPHAIAPTANVCYARRVWDIIGPFEGHLFCGDAIQSWRAAAAGFRPWFEPRAVVEHRHRGGFVSFWKERWRRSQEFEDALIEFFRRPRWKSALLVPLMPGLLALVLGRAAADAWRAGRLGSCLATLPVQIIGQLAWCLGEAKSRVAHAAGRRKGVLLR